MPSPAVRTVLRSSTDRLTRVVAEGDSQTSLVVGTYNDSYAWNFYRRTPSKSVVNRAQGSRTLGVLSDLDSQTNTLFSHMTQDMAFQPQVFTMMIGANSTMNAGTTGTAYWASIVDYLARFRGRVRKMGVATELPWDNRHGVDYSTFNAARAVLNSTIRSNFTDIADFFVPLGDIPEINAYDGSTNNPYLTDGVHHAANAIQMMNEVYKAVMDPLLAGSTELGPPNSAWFGAGTTNAARSTTITYRTVITGMKPGYVAPISISSAAAAAGVTFSIGAGSADSSAKTGANGDVMLLNVPTSASFSTATPVTVTIGTTTISLTVQTGATDPAVITLDPANKYPTATVTKPYLRDFYSVTGGAIAKCKTTATVTGKRYMEMTCIPTLQYPPNAIANSRVIGVCDAAYNVVTNTSNAYAGYTANPNQGSTYAGSVHYTNGAVTGAIGTTAFADGDVAMMAVDTTAGKIYYGKNGTWCTGHNPSAGTGGITMTTPPAEYYAYVGLQNETSLEINCGQDTFRYTLPTGYSAWG